MRQFLEKEQRLFAWLVTLSTWTDRSTNRVHIPGHSTINVQTLTPVITYKASSRNQVTTLSGSMWNKSIFRDVQLARRGRFNTRTIWPTSNLWTSLPLFNIYGAVRYVPANPPIIWRAISRYHICYPLAGCLPLMRSSPKIYVLPGYTWPNSPLGKSSP
jgi:hypothetical protein